MIFINIRGVPAAFWEETPFSGVSAIYRSDIVALVQLNFCFLKEMLEGYYQNSCYWWKRGVSESFPTVMLQNWKHTKIWTICGMYRSFAKTLKIKQETLTL